MSLTTYHNGDYFFECDGKGCTETLPTASSNFDSAMNALKRAHWKPRKPQGIRVEHWYHLCCECNRGVFVHLKDGTVL